MPRPLRSRCRPSPWPRSTGRTLKLCVALRVCTQHTFGVTVHTQLGTVRISSCISHGMCAALAGWHCCLSCLLSADGIADEAPMGTGEHIAHHARMPCPRAHAFAHPHASHMRALRFCALPTLPACVICGAHAVCVCCAQACDVVQARVQGGGVGVWDAAGEGWVGQGSSFACGNAGAVAMNS